MLNAASCDLFDRPFFQFAQLKQFQPDEVENIKTDYRRAWLVWKELIGAVAVDLGAEFAAPHIERWSNGWQVRAHFFAFFKYAANQDSAAILSVLLNRRRLTVSLDWHAYRADRSQTTLAQYNQWPDAADWQHFADWDVWHDSEGEYADYRRACDLTEADRRLQSDQDFLCIGRHIERDRLAQTDCRAWIAQSIRELLPLYEACYK